MKRIAFYSREFRLCEWPEEPTTHRWSPDDSDDADYAQAVTSAMENGVEFESQFAVKKYVWGLYKWVADQQSTEEWQVPDGGNWDCPENVGFQYQLTEDGGKTWKECPEPTYNYYKKLTTTNVRKVAIFKSESVEKKETGKQRAYQKMLRYLISIRDSAAEAGELSFLPQAINTMTDIINDAINHSEYDR